MLLLGKIPNGALITTQSLRFGATKQDNAHFALELLATIYHAVGINPTTIVYNHLNQPRELVKAKAVTQLFA